VRLIYQKIEIISTGRTRQSGSKKGQRRESVRAIRQSRGERHVMNTKKKEVKHKTVNRDTFRASKEAEWGKKKRMQTRGKRRVSAKIGKD